MANIDVLAEEIKKELSELDAMVCYSIEFDLHDLEECKCIIVPIGVEYKRLSRSMVEVLYRIEIGIFLKSKTLEMEKQISEIQDLAKDFLGKKITTATCVKVEHAPLYDQDLLQQRNQFTGVVALSFKDMQNG